MFRTSTFDLPLNRAVSGLAKALAELDPDTLLPDVQAAQVFATTGAGRNVHPPSKSGPAG